MNLMGLYTLDKDGKPVPCESVEEWGAFMAHPDGRRVKVTLLANGGRVSTVFLGAEHGRDKFRRAIVFETMVFVDDKSHGIGEGLDGAMRRYATIEEARAGHEEMLAEVYAAEPALKLEG